MVLLLLILLPVGLLLVEEAQVDVSVAGEAVSTLLLVVVPSESSDEVEHDDRKDDRSLLLPFRLFLPLLLVESDVLEVERRDAFGDSNILLAFFWNRNTWCTMDWGSLEQTGADDNIFQATDSVMIYVLRFDVTWGY